MNHPVEATDRSDRVASTSSTYVYTYVPTGETVGGADVIVAEPKPSLENGDGPELNEGFWQRRLPHRSSDKDTQVLTNQFNRTAADQSSNNTTSRGWLTRHIFGLEQTDSAESPSSQFISSDAEDVDTMISSRSHSRRKVDSTVGHSATIRTSVVRKSQGIFGRTFDYGVRVLRRLLSIILTILLSILYTGYALLSGAVYVTTSAVRTVSSKLFTSGSSRSSGKLALHPRLTRFDHSATSISSVDEEPDFLTRSMHSTAFGLSKLGSCCCRLCGILCFLIPLFLLLAFLFAPVSIDDGDDETPPMLLPHLTDANCQQVLPHYPMPDNSSSWSLAIWRFRCLYWLYFLDSPPTSESMENVSSEPTIDTAATWSKWLFGWFAKPTSVDTVSQSIPIGQSADATRLLEQLATFSQAVNKRLDSLSMSIRVTETRVADVENQSNDRVKNLSAQLLDLQAQFHTHTASIHEWRLHMLSLANQSGPEVSTLTGEYDRLFHAVTEAVNHTVMFYLEQLRTDVNDSVTSQLGRHDATMVNLSLLLAQLRHQLARRLRYAENKLSQLNFQLRTELSKQSGNQTALATEINEIRSLIDNMSDHLVLFQKSNAETNALITDLQEASTRCTQQQSQQLNSCKQVASDYVEAAIGRLTTLLTAQIADLVKENFIQQLQPSDSVVHTKLSAMIEQVTRETVAVALRDHIQTEFTDTTGKPIIHPDYFNVQRQIDASLERFAADRTGLPDFALESAGGTVIATRCTRTYTGGAALFSLFGIPLVRLSNSPRTILHPSNNAGDCWPFHGSSGQVVIRLSDPIVINAVSLEHLPRVLARTGRSDSAPKDFLIKGLASEVDEEGVVLGNFTYNIDGPSIQTYPIKASYLILMFLL
ncbi:SUN domain-containing protein 2 [Paragonimus heterotremus]|uniref:SUN domain-containing protein 2 n=1 Tax=Paragonimus heterotremus TaxID=100268 RepID=A0A8J4WPX6_9TREM|nr:SUN domain-containing protein 2 [Paragonimus heterotremus]